MKKICIRAAVIGFWLAVWQLLAVLVDNRILLAGPSDVCARLFEELGNGRFYQSVFGSLSRILAGFLLGMLAGAAIGACAFRFPSLKLLLEPVVLAMKSVPVAAFVILVLIWIGSKNLAVPISFLVVFPYFYIHTMAGLGEADAQLLEFARVSGMRAGSRFFFIYRPALLPYLTSAARVTIGMSFKSGIAAEVIGIPELSIGNRLYLSKVYLDTAGVLAWTVVVVLLSFLCEKLLLFCIRRAGERPVTPRAGKRSVRPGGYCVPSLRKTYGGRTVVDMQGFRCGGGERIAAAGASGSGKTTWLRLLMGLEQPDREEGRTPEERQRPDAGPMCAAAPVFQEDRLCMAQSAVDNVRMVCAPENAGRIREALLCLLPEEALDRPVSELSGGMRRRVAVARAVLSGGGVLLMDEPFTGLDEENKEKLAAFILARQGGRTLLFTVHGEREAGLLAPDKILRF